MRTLLPKSFLLAAVVVCGLTIVSVSPTLAREKKAPGAVGGMGAEKRFIKKAGAGNAAESQLGELAQKNGENAEVKQFGAQMVTDHGQANTNLSAIATRSGVTPFPPEPSAKQKKTYAKLSQLTGAAFDTAYVNDMVKDHLKDVADYKKAQGVVTDPDLKKYVDATLPIVEHHLQMVKEMQAKMGGAPAKGKKAKKMS
jgi:putative membrane protein